MSLMHNAASYILHRGISMKLAKLGTAIAAMLISISASAMTQTSPITGKWQTIDDKTHVPSSVITVEQYGPNLVGTISKIYLENHHKTTDVCVNCKGPLHNKPMLGMAIMHATLKTNGDVEHCRILDPQIGKLYHCTLRLANNDQELHLRGYIGFPLIGRTAKWYRLQPQATKSTKK